MGDDITFRDGVTKRLYDGRIVGFEGPTALIKWGNSDRRVPTRELLPRRQRYQDSESEKDTDSEGQSDPDRHHHCLDSILVNFDDVVRGGTVVQDVSSLDVFNHSRGEKNHF